MTDAATPWDAALIWVALVLTLVGLALMARAGLTLLQPNGDPYRRLHGVVIGQSLAVGLIAAGLGLAFSSFAVFGGLALIALGLAGALPVLAQASANAAHADGAEPRSLNRPGS